MTDPCILFRRALMDALSTNNVTRELGWHEHVLTCAECREVLEREEALEMLLASLPEPRLPEALAERLVARLAPMLVELRDPRDASDAGGSLESLLELDRTPDVPIGLAQRILEGVAHERDRSSERHEAALDRLLDRVQVEVPPADLAERVLANLETDRRGATVAPIRSGRAVRANPQRSQRAASPSRTLSARAAAALFVLAAAAVLVIFVVLGKDRTNESVDRSAPFATGPRERELVARVDSPGSDEAVATPGAPTSGEATSGTSADPSVVSADPVGAGVEPELLEALELLENWEAITSDDLDLLLAELDELDATLLEHLPTEEEEG